VSYEEEDTCVSYEEEDTCVSYEEEDTRVASVSAASFFSAHPLLNYLNPKP